MAYESTNVAVSKSQGDIRKLLRGHGTDGHRFGEFEDQDGRSWAVMEFVQAGHAVRMQVPMKVYDESAARELIRKSKKRVPADVIGAAEEQEARRIWRVLHWNLKARLEAVEEGLETFVEAFLSHLVVRATGKTVYESLVEEGRVELDEPLPQRLALPEGA